MAAQTPRKKKPKKTVSTHTSSVTTGPTGRNEEPRFPLAAFLWCVSTETSAWITLPPILLVAMLFRVALGFWGYSGYQAPPMHGDFEAQRHWMELTINLPMTRWYFYDLQYWGLDYPPLTAYHSWLMGMIAWLTRPKWVELDTSRGIEDPDLKLFMRISVLASEYLVYMPAAYFCIRRLGRLSRLTVWDSWIILVAFLMQPPTMLIDHGHFQYNTVMLGLVLGAITNALADRLLWSSVFFVAALAYKQMALYFAPVFFAFLLGRCIRPPQPLRLITIALVTLATFALAITPLVLGTLYSHYQNPNLDATLEPSPLFNQTSNLLPFALDSISMPYAILLQTTQLLHRVFPFARGLFEDKVANFWCALHTIYKLHHLSTPLLTRASAALTALAFLPAFITILLAPQPRLLLPALASSAWAFFLFSFQVHEKSVLLPLLPMTLMLADAHHDGASDKHGLVAAGGPAPAMRAWVGWANALGAWTLYPLLRRDGLAVPYAVLALLWAYLLGLPPADWTMYDPRGREGVLPLPNRLLHAAFYGAMILWHVTEKFVAPPAGKPDLWVVINCVVGAAGFAVCYAWCTWHLFERSGLVAFVAQKLQEHRQAKKEAKSEERPVNKKKSKQKGR